MKINRAELLALLKLAEPALAGSKNPVQEMCCLWFSGSHLSAYNDLLGVEVVLKTEFTGGINGEKLIALLDRSHVKEVDIETDGEEVLLKIGRARIKLARRPIEDWFWHPEVPVEPGFLITKGFHEGVELALMSVGAPTVENAEQRGVTAVQNGEAVDLYSTDGVSLSWAHVVALDTAIGPAGSRVILPTPFCERLAALKSDAELRFDENAVYCLTSIDLTNRKQKDEVRKAYEMLVFSRLVDDDDPVSFVDVVGKHASNDDGVEVPAQLKQCIERAMVLLTEQPLEVEVEDGNLYLFADAPPYGEVDDVLKFPAHPNVKAKLDAALLHRALDGRETVHISKEAVVLRGPKSFLHILACK